LRNTYLFTGIPSYFTFYFYWKFILENWSWRSWTPF